MKHNQITFGTDPEFLVSVNGVPTSVIGKLGGSKAEPMDIGNGCGLQEDNVMAELTTPVIRTRTEFIDYINYGKTKIKEIFDKNTGLNCKVESISSGHFSAEDINNPIAQQFGCEPSFCIYTRAVSPRPKPEDVGNLRSAGFHVHTGFPKLLNVDEKIRFIFFMDIMLGLPSIIIDEDSQRRKLYGNAGDFRTKYITEIDTTIIEYRTLGARMHQNDELIGWVFDQTNRAVNLFCSNVSINDFCKNNDIIFEEIEYIINNEEKQKAMILCDLFNINIKDHVRELVV